MSKINGNGNLWKILIWGGSIIFAAGTVFMIVQNNTRRIDKVEEQAGRTNEEFLEFRGEMRQSIINIEKALQI